MKPLYEVADVIRRYGEAFRTQRPVLDYHRRVLSALENCRTPSPGGHAERCDACGEVTFSYRDYADGGKVRTVTLSATEFLRRFRMHILPKGFRKIRQYGILSSRNKKRLKEVQTKIPPTEPEKTAQK